MAVGIHIAKTFDPIDGPLKVKADDNITNTANEPTVVDYLLAEAGDNYLLNHMGNGLVITLDAAAINAL